MLVEAGKGQANFFGPTTNNRCRCLPPAIRYNDNIYVHQCTGVLLKRPYRNMPTASPTPMAAPENAIRSRRNKSVYPLPVSYWLLVVGCFAMFIEIGCWLFCNLQCRFSPGGGSRVSDGQSIRVSTETLQLAPHNTKPEDAVPEARVAEVAGGTTEVEFIVDPRAAAQRTISFSIVNPIRHPLPDITGHVH